MENQNTNNSNLASAVIQNLLQKEGVTKILSARIGVELNKHNINYRDGGTKLKHYLLTNVPGLKLIEKIGLDEFWGFSGEVNSSPLNPELQEQDNPWKELASPSSSRTVAWCESEQRWIVIQLGMSPTTDHWIVKGVTRAELTEIANEFAEKYEATLKNSPDLLAAIRRNNVSWHQRFVRIFPQLAPHWSDIRIDGIKKIIKERLREARINGQALPEATLESAVLAMDSIRQEASQSRRVDTRVVQTPPISLREKYHGPDAIRELAMKVISEMGDSDIRKIWLPLGSIFDAIN